MAHRRKRQRQTNVDAELSMTPMIDIVFQLLIYFILTFEPQDVMAHLDVFRPAPDQQRKEQMEVPNVLRVVIYQDGFTVNDRQMTLPRIEATLGRLAELDPNQTVLIMATASSYHRNLIEILDLCSKVGLRNLSVVSMN
jgi:biopolymer transport protein ExbD